MKDNADDVVASLLYTGPEGSYLLNHEEIFQATSKSSGRGVTHISGHSDMRLSSYKLETGELVGRVKLGDMIDEGCALLGYSPGKVWMFSMEEDLGLHYRDPITLEVKESWETLSQKPGLSAFKPAPPQWSTIDQFYAWDWETGKLMLTDTEGFRYLFDPEKFTIEKTEAGLPDVDWDEDATGNSGEFVEDDTYYLQGDTRKVFTFHDKKSSGDVSFLFGELFLDQHPGKAADRKNAARKALDQNIQTLKDSLASFSAAHPEATQEPDWRTWTNAQRDLHYQAGYIQQAIEDEERDRKDLESFHHAILDYPLLTGDSKSAYVRYASAINDTAHTLVAKVNFAADTTWTVAWSTHLTELYFNPSKADDMGAFETVYSKGNPEFDYKWAGTDGKYLLLVWQLRLTCIDMATGKVVWEKQV